MKTRFLFVLFMFLFIGFYSCISEVNKKVRLATDSTDAFINRWEKKNKEQLLTPEDRRSFTDQWNQLVQTNKVLGVVREKLSKEKIKEVEMLYGRAKALKNVMIMQEIQNNLQRRGSNSADGEKDSGQLKIDF
ncbi:MAG: hypothetical protein EOP00_18760 [Pedobacter sp.]|nr:MAG: hypothetical protein EOP00_18760 [Pedobacter sp.]